MRLRILMLTHRLPYAPNRGDRIRAYHLVKLLASQHDVHLVSLIHDAEEAAHLADLEGRVASIDGAPAAGPRRFVDAALALPGPVPLTHVLLHSHRMREILQRRVHIAQPHVLVAYCTGMARYALEPPLRDLPCVLDMVDVDSEKWAALAQQTSGPRGWVFRREARRLRAFERQIMRHARATAVSSDRERMSLTEAAPEAAPVTVPSGVDAAFFAPVHEPAADPGVVFSGVFNYAPNEDGAVWFAREVWPLVRQRQPAARLTLVGMHPTRLVRSLAADPSIVVTGAVPDVRPYLWRAALAVAPLRVARGVQNKVLEAIAAGLPCVVTPEVFAGLPDAVRPACKAAAEPEAFARALVEWLALGGSQRQAIAARVSRDDITWERQLHPFLDLVEQAARSGPA